MPPVTVLDTDALETHPPVTRDTAVMTSHAELVKFKPEIVQALAVTVPVAIWIPFEYKKIWVPLAAIAVPDTETVAVVIGFVVITGTGEDANGQPPPAQIQIQVGEDSHWPGNVWVTKYAPFGKQLFAPAHPPLLELHFQNQLPSGFAEMVPALNILPAFGTCKTPASLYTLIIAPGKALPTGPSKPFFGAHSSSEASGSVQVAPATCKLLQLVPDSTSPVAWAVAVTFAFAIKAGEIVTI